LVIQLIYHLSYLYLCRPIILVFCVVLFCVFTFWVPCCDVRYDFRIKTMFGLFLPPVVCRRAHVLFTLFVFVCVKWCPTQLCCVFVLFVFVLCLVFTMLHVSMDCPFLIAPSVFSNVSFKFNLNWAKNHLLADLWIYLNFCSEIPFIIFKEEM
jgi:hypothetical protein